jgi:phosphotransacetylase
MNNGTERLTVVNATAERLYRAAKQLSISERAALVNKLTHGCDEQETTVSVENISALAKTLHQINFMTQGEMALVLDAIASKLRNPGANAKRDDN